MQTGTVRRNGQVHEESRFQFWRSRWWMPSFCLFLGGLVLAAFWVGGDPWAGVGGMGVMAALGALFLFGRRSETLQGLGGPGRDERWLKIDVYATAASGLTVITVLIGAWLVDLARGGDGSPYGQVLAIGGLAYIAAVAFFRWRS
jgi:hypothetical protein